MDTSEDALLTGPALSTEAILFITLSVGVLLIVLVVLLRRGRSQWPKWTLREITLKVEEPTGPSAEAVSGSSNLDATLEVLNGTDLDLTDPDLK